MKKSIRRSSKKLSNSAFTLVELILSSSISMIIILVGYYLSNIVSKANKNDKSQIESNNKLKNKYLVELHKKFSIPIACIVFIIVGAPIGIATRKGKFAISMAISLTFFIIYWAFLIAGENFADQGSINPALAMWLPNIILLIICIYFNYRINKGQKIFTIPYFKLFKKFIIM